MVHKIHWQSHGYIKREVTNRRNERRARYRQKERKTRRRKDCARERREENLTKKVTYK